MKKRQKYRLKFGTVVVTFCILYIILFTIAMCFLMYKGQTINDSLIYCTFSFFTVELLSLAGIKVSKHKYTNTYQENLDAQEEEEE